MWDKNKIPLKRQWIAIKCCYWTLKHAVTAHRGVEVAECDKEVYVSRAPS